MPLLFKTLTCSSIKNSCMRKLLFLVVAPLLAAMAITSCGQTEAVAENDSLSLKLGVLPTMECLPFYYADSLGLFDSLGVDIKLVTFDAAMDADTAFQRGHIDGIVSDLVKDCIWKGNGDSLTIVMGADLNLWLVTSRTARLVKAESLKDKIIGITRHSSVDFFADKILESVKIESIDLNKPQINKFTLRTLMVDQNQYDGAILPEPFASEAVARGAKRLNGTSEMKIADMMCVLFPDSLMKTRKDEIESIAKVYDLAIEKLNSDTVSNVLEFFPKNNTLFLPDTLFTYTPLKPSHMPSDSTRLMVEKWAKGRGLIK